MAAKTRYLQLSDIIMFEYEMLGADDECKIQYPGSFIRTRTIDDHELLISPVSYECEVDTTSTDESYKKMYNSLSLNTLNHLAVPIDKECSEFYSFRDNDYVYVNSNNFTSSVSSSDIKVSEYDSHLSKLTRRSVHPLGDVLSVHDVRWDSIKLYFVNGYDFSNLYGLMMRITVDTEIDSSDSGIGKLDLCSFIVTKDNFFNLIKYLPNPIIFGNNIYDRCVEVNVACLYDLIHGDVASQLNVKNNSIVRAQFSYILDEDKEISSITEGISDSFVFDSSVIENVRCIFNRSSSLNGSIPTEEMNSDNLGCYISECTNAPYLEFYGTWKGNPLDCETVWSFNKSIKLYDSKYIKSNSVYEVDDNYQVGYDVKRWMCLHEIKCSFCVNDKVIREEKYNMSQLFYSTDDSIKFYYRPSIFDENQGLYINNIQITYTMRFMNVNDMVQFVKVGTLSLVGNTAKYYAKGNSLGSNVYNYNVFNKIVNNTQEIKNSDSGSATTKYVKIYYDSNTIVLDQDGNQYGSYDYTLKLSQMSKTYKFTFKKATDNGSYDYLDLTNNYYKLMFKDANGIDVAIEPTYSSNMNLYLGEVEFNISSSVVNKLMNISEGNRNISIVSVSENGNVSSMFDMKFEF